jgi:RimJ/RimL family protein N-acetyltransferase
VGRHRFRPYLHRVVEIVPLPAAVLRALGAGDRAAAEAGSPVPLGPHLTGPAHRALWAYRSGQVDQDPAAADWVTGVVWDPRRRLAVGRAGFHGPPVDGMVEVGYAIDPPYRRRGYARAALRLLLERAAADPAVRTVRASVRPDNAASLALVRAHGFVAVGEQVDEVDGPEIVLEVPAGRTAYRATVLHPTEPLVLADPPEVVLPGRVWWGRTPVLVDAFQDRHGLDLTVLRAAEGRLLTVLRSGTAGRWVPPAGPDAELVRLATAPGVTPAQPWLRRDWLPAAEAWLGRGRLAQHKVWDLSAVLRTGGVWLKSTVAAPLFAPEAAVTVALAALFPAHVPRPVAADGARGLLALPDLGPELGWDAPVAVRAGMYAAHARLQRASVPHVAALRAAGCLDRGLPWLAGAVAEWLTPARLARFVPAPTVGRLVAAVPVIAALGRELAAYGLPATLLHNDLHPGNVAAGYLEFDWTDAAVGHPFLDLASVVLADDPAPLRDAYLAEWPGDLAGAWPVTRVLAAANQVVSYLALADFLGSGALFGSFTAQWLDRLLAVGAEMGAWPP